MGLRHEDTPPELDQLAERVIGAAIEVHRTLGAGLLERSHEIALSHELNLRSIPFETQLDIQPECKGVHRRVNTTKNSSPRLRAPSAPPRT